ncbi:Uncharacterised protein [uncultured archaeon]|nr:Uncharacterised protein [uncultured archaeon]
MSDVTVFLGVMVAALAAGNGILILMKPRKGAAQLVIEANRDYASGAADANAGDSRMPSGQHGFGNDSLMPQGNQGSAAPQASLHRYSLLPVEKKVELAHARIHALESRVKAMQGVYENGFRNKVEKLDAFRATANAEIIALKEIVDEMQKRIPIGGNASRKNGQGGDGNGEKFSGGEDISTDDMRRLIYRARS